MLFDNLYGLLRVVIVSIAAYGALIVVLRVAGKRALAKLNAFDLVVTVALGSTLATILLSEQVALAEGVLAFVMLAGLQWVVARTSTRWKPIARLVRSRPRLLLRDGRFCEDAMRRERVLHTEVEQAIRRHGIGRVEEVAAVVLETDGSFSVIKCRDDNKDLSALASVEC